MYALDVEIDPYLTVDDTSRPALDKNKKGMMGRLERVSCGKTFLLQLYLLLSIRHFIVCYALIDVIASNLLILPFAFNLLLSCSVTTIFYRIFVCDFKWSSYCTFLWSRILIAVDIIVNLALSLGFMIGFQVLLLEPHGLVNYYWRYMYAIIVCNTVMSLLQVLCVLPFMCTKYQRLEKYDSLEVINRSQDSTDATMTSSPSDRSTTATNPTTTTNTTRYNLMGGKPRSSVLSSNVIFYIIYLFAFIGIFGLVLSSITLIRVFSSPTSMLERTTSSHLPDNINPTCDQLCSEHCLLPFPNSRYLKDDPETVTGFRVNFSQESLPKTRWGTLDPSSWNEADGFSILAPLLFTLPEDVVEKDLVHFNDIGNSVELNTSTTLLINAETLELVPHWVDRDSFDTSYGSFGRPPILILQPAVPLEHNQHYICVIRNLHSSVNPSNIIKPSEAFMQLMNPESIGDVDVDKRSAYFKENVFKVIEETKLGIDPKTLQLAFDFRTISKLSSLGRLESMKESALDWFEEKATTDDFDWAVEKIEEGECQPGELIGRTIWGYVHTPSYLLQPGPHANAFLTEDTEKPKIGGRYIPHQIGTERVSFVLSIPCSVLHGIKPVTQLVQLGHGLFNTRDEARHWYNSDMANTNGWIILASDWAGMSKFDLLPTLKSFMVNASQLKMLPERLMQAFVNKMVVLKFVQTQLLDESFFTTKNSPVSQLLSAETPFSFYGISQGSVVGGGYFAFSPVLRRAVLNVPGTPFALLLSRSANFGAIYQMLKLQFYSSHDIRITITALQHLWDPAETSGWLWRINDEEESKTLKKEVLLVPALGDAQVSTLGAHIMARAFNASTIFPETRAIYGVTERVGPFEGNSVMEFEYKDNNPGEMLSNSPPQRGSNTHECPRREQDNFLLMKDFLENSENVNHCGEQCVKDVCRVEPQYRM